MAGENEKETPTKAETKAPEGETNEQKEAREAEERAANAAEAKVKGWVSEALKTELPGLLKGSSPGSAGTNSQPKRVRKSIFQIITGG